LIFLIVERSTSLFLSCGIAPHDTISFQFDSA
jgi:hypothetical protein